MASKDESDEQPKTDEPSAHTPLLGVLVFAFVVGSGGYALRYFQAKPISDKGVQAVCSNSCLESFGEHLSQMNFNNHKDSISLTCESRCEMNIESAAKHGW